MLHRYFSSIWHQGLNPQPLSCESSAYLLGVQVLCSTGLCSTIEIEEKLFDEMKKLWCSTQIMFDVEAAIVKQNIIWTKSMAQIKFN